MLRDYAGRGQVDQLRQLFIYGNHFIDDMDQCGYTALHRASMGGNAECIRVRNVLAPLHCLDELSLRAVGTALCWSKYQQQRCSRVHRALCCRTHFGIGQGEWEEPFIGAKGVDLQSFPSQELLSVRCLVDVANNDGVTPLARAIQMHARECVKLLLDAGARLHLVEPVVDIPPWVHRYVKERAACRRAIVCIYGVLRRRRIPYRFPRDVACKIASMIWNTRNALIWQQLAQK